MKIKFIYRIVFFVAIFCCFNSGKVQAALSPGDIAIIGYKSEPGGEAVNTSFEFTFILLTNVNAGEAPITFTDHGWIAGAFNTNIIAEGYLTWSPASNYPAGTIIKVTVNTGNPNPGTFSSTNASFTTQSAVSSGWTNATISSSGGDQILVFQGTTTSPIFIYGFTNTASETVHPTPGTWASSGVANGATNSELPPGLVNGQTAVAHTNDANTPIPNTRNASNGWSTDNLVFNGPFVANKAQMLTNIGTQSNWNGSEAAPNDINITPGGGTIPTTMAVPNIEVTDNSGTINIPNNAAASGFTNFGSLCVSGASVSKTFMIKNTGFANLSLSSVPPAILGGGGATSYSIVAQPAASIAPGASTTLTVSFDPTTTGTLAATITVANNDATKTPFIINVSGTGSSPDATITANNSVCQGSSIGFSVPSAGAGATYSWSGNGIIAANANSTTATPQALNSQVYKVTVTTAAGCSATASKTVTVNPKPILSVAAGPSICYGEKATLTANCIMNVSAVLSPGALASTASGYVYGTYNMLNNQLDLTVVYQGLTSNITNAHIHVGAAGTNGGVIVQFAGWPANSTSGTFTYSGAGLPAANLSAFLAGNTYVNIHSTNFPGGEIRGQLMPDCSSKNYLWNTNETTQSITAWPAVTQQYSVSASNNVSGCVSDLVSTTVTVAPITLPTDAFSTVTKDVADLYFVTPTCKNLAEVIPDGSPTTVAGSVTVKQWLETTPPYQYVPRHYEITPATNPNGVSGRITLYFSQADFDAFNAIVSSQKLPTNGSDVAGIANFQIAKYSGTSPNGLPGAGGYVGPPTLIPASGDSWNGPSNNYKMVFENNVWKVTFPVSSFSGFIATSVAQPLPLKLLSFEGANTVDGNLLTWTTTAEKDFSHFEVQKSTDAQKFDAIAKVEGSSNEAYSFIDKNIANSAIAYYRLKMVDLDGTYNFSKTIVLENLEGADLVGNIYPNPSTGPSYVDLRSPKAAIWTVTYSSLNGKILQVQTMALPKGSNTIKLENLPAGISFVKFSNGSTHITKKVLRQ